MLSNQFLIIGFYCIISNLCQAQVTFNSTYDSGGAETIFNILPKNGGYITVANVNQIPDKYQFMILDSSGVIVMAKSYETPSVNTIIYSLLQTFDGNYATGCFYQDLISNNRKIFIVKLNNLGDTLWSQVISASFGYHYYGRYFINTSDNGFLFTGAYVDTLLNNSDFFILKADSAGNQQWVQNFGGSAYDDAFSSVQTPDKGFLTLGVTRSFGFGNSWNRDELLVKWDSVGNYQWHKTYGSSDDEFAICISKLDDGNYMLGSITYNSSTSIQNGKLIKVDINGDVIWQKYYASKSSFWWLQEQANTDIVVVGSSRQSNNIDDGLIIRNDSAGNEKWRRQYRFGNDHCYFRDVQETSDGGIICSGFVFDGASGNQDGWLVKLDSTGCLSNGCGEPTGLLETSISSNYNISIYPNPVINDAIVKVEGLSQHILDKRFVIKIIDMSGKIVATPETGFLITETGFQFIFERELLQSGIYLMSINTSESENLGVVKIIVN